MGHLFDRLFLDLPRQNTIDIRAIKRELPEDSPDKIRQRFFINTIGAMQWAKQQALEGFEAYYGVAVRKGHDGSKAGVAYTRALWADLDGSRPLKDLTSFILPPGVVVHSGTGMHAYWFLTDPLSDLQILENMLKLIQTSFGGDPGAAEAARVLRVPGTLNYKYNPPRPVEVVYQEDANYTLEDLQAAFRLNSVTVTTITTGHITNGDSRSERDFHVVGDLVEAGFTDAGILYLFDHWPIGDKAKEARTYLPHTIKQVRGQKKQTTIKVKGLNPPVGPAAETDPTGGKEDGLFGGMGIQIRQNCYVFVPKKGDMVELSSFVFRVKAIHTGEPGQADVFICDVLSKGGVTTNVAISTEVFNSAPALRRALPRASWAWYGSDRQTNLLKQLLYLQWQATGQQEVYTTNLIGRQYEPDRDLDIAVDIMRAFDRTGQIRPDVLLRTSPGAQHLSIEYPSIDSIAAREPVEEALNILLQVQPLDVILPILGWWCASVFKPVLAQMPLSFPHLVIHGTRGSGKTTIIAKIMQPLFGYTKPELFLCSTTPHALTTLLGVTESVPICLTEYREGTKHESTLMQTLRSAYDSGAVSKGKADQSTVTYRLSAPVCIDGEDMSGDPAMQERTVSIKTVPETTRQLRRQTALNQYLRHDVTGFIYPFIRHCMSLDAFTVYQMGLGLMEEAFFEPLPERTRHNYSVVAMGLQALASFCVANDISIPLQMTPGNLREWFLGPITEIIDPAMGRTILAVDIFISDVLTYIAQAKVSGQPDFAFRERSELIGFHLHGAYNWWAADMARRRKDPVPLRTIRDQLRERQMSEGEIPMRGQYYFGSERAHIPSVGTMLLEWVSMKQLTAAGIETFQNTELPATNGSGPGMNLDTARTIKLKLFRAGNEQ